MDSSTVVPLPEIDLPLAWRLAPGVELLWRGDGSFQLEHDERGVVVAGLDRAVARALARRERPRGPGPVSAAPVVRPSGQDLAALHRLAELGYVFTHGTREPAAGPVAVAPAIEPPELLPARRVAAARRELRVDVVGVTRVSAYVGALLGAAGVGRVGFASAGVVRRRHLLPGGLAAADEGRRFGAAAADVVARSAPHTDVSPPVEGEPDLVVVCLEAPLEPDLRELLHRQRRAHLAVHVDARRGEVGPLVIPGVSACLRCADLHRLDQDPSWSVLAVQLIAGAERAAPSDPGLAARVGALAAAVALRWLDDDPDAAGALGGSWELRHGWIAPRRRGRRPHPECGCRAAWG